MFALPLSGIYAAYFTVTGVQLPFWPVWLSAQGLEPATLGIVMAISFGAKAVSTPLVAHFADRSGKRRRLIATLAFVSLGGFTLFHWADSVWALVAVSVLFFSAWPPVMSLTESVTMLCDQRGQVDYGRVRLWGSLTFIVAAILSGRLLVDLPADTIYWLVLAALAITCAATLALPDVRGERHGRGKLPLLTALGNRRLTLALIACGLIQGSHAVYYGFASLYWKSIGFSADIIGLLWAEGVIAEIILFAIGRRLLRTSSPSALIALAGAACAVRWTGTAFADTLPALLTLQALHAFSFGAAHLGAMHLIGREVPGAQSATAQSLYSSLVWGISIGVVLYVAGFLYAALSGLAFLAMAGVGAMGFAVALVLMRVGGPFDKTQA